MSSVTVRRATAADGETVARFLTGLAVYEKLTPPDEASAKRIIADIADGSRIQAFVAETEGRAVGFAIVYETYSTFRGLPKLYLEDLFVDPDARSTGAGLALFRAVATEAIRRNCDALEWEVLDWNRLALDFYDRLGAHPEKVWLPYRMEREVMEQLANGERND